MGIFISALLDWRAEHRYELVLNVVHLVSTLDQKVSVIIQAVVFQ